MIELKHEKQVQISECNSFVILFKLNYFMRIHMIFHNKFVRKKKSTFLRFFLDIFKTNVNVILIVYLLFESNYVAVTI